jgi:hypothetical protein
MKTNPSEQVFEPLLNSREAGKLLGVHPATMKRVARAGKPMCEGREVVAVQGESVRCVGRVRHDF